MCDYVAKKDDPETWHGDDSTEWILDSTSERGGLEIEKWRCPHPSLDGENRCIFHTEPDELAEDIDESEELLNALDKTGKSPFDDGPEHRGQFVGATFGALDLSGEMIIADEHSVRFDHAMICGYGQDILFNNTKFVTRKNGSISFHRASFSTSGEGSIEFNRAEFTVKGSGNVDFEEAEFTTEGLVDFREAEFINENSADLGVAFFPTEDVGHVNFGEAKFTTDDLINFRGVKFISKGVGDVDFSGVEFSTEGSVYFNKAKFTTNDVGRVQFSGSEFTTETEVLFTGADFITKGEGNLEFYSAKFTTEGEGDVAFHDANFITEGEGNVVFEGSKYTAEGDGRVDFILTDFITKGVGNINLKETEFSTKGEDDVSFTRANFTTKSPGKINFSGSVFSNTGGGSIYFRDAKFGGFGIISSWYKTSLSRGFYEPVFYKKGTGKIQFNRTTFTSENVQDFLRIKFTDDTDFTEATFNCPVRFNDWFVDTNVTLSFSKSEFIEPCQFGSSEGGTEFQGTLNFSEVTFHKEVNFEGETSNTATPRSIDPDSSDEFDVTFSGNLIFRNATLPEGTNLNNTKFPDGADFSGANLTGVNFRRSDLSGANLERALLNRAELLGTNLIGAKLYGVLLGDVRINHQTSFWPTTDISLKNALLYGDKPVPGGLFKQWKGWVRQGSIPFCCYDPRYDSIDSLPSYQETNTFEEADEKFRLEKAAEVYGTLETAARNNSLPRVASEAFVGRKDVQRKQYYRDDDQGRQWLLYVRSLVPNAIARYGESPWRVLGYGTFTVVFCGLLYWVFDLIDTQGDGDPATLLDSIYFSSLTFTTLGYGDFKPTNGYGQFLAVSETAVGVIMLAILVFVFGRRATR